MRETGDGLIDVYLGNFYTGDCLGGLLTCMNNLGPLPKTIRSIMYECQSASFIRLSSSHYPNPRALLSEPTPSLEGMLRVAQDIGAGRRQWDVIGRIDCMTYKE